MKEKKIMKFITVDQETWNNFVGAINEINNLVSETTIYNWDIINILKKYNVRTEVDQDEDK